MPPRLNKRQLREQEELQALQEAANDEALERVEKVSHVESSNTPIASFAAVR